MSIGEAQYDRDQVSLKVWRHTGDLAGSNGRWSPQSEELPIHRNLDLSILFLTVLSGTNGNSLNTTGPFQIEINQQKELHRIGDYYEENKEIVDARLRELKRLLNGLPL